MSNHSDAHAGDTHPDHGHHGNIKTYLSVAVILGVLTFLSFATYLFGWFGDSPHAQWAWMMAISCGKASLVILFFMHLLWEANWKYVLTIPAGIMSTFLVLALVPDIGWRMDHYSEERWLHAAEPRAAAEQEHSNSAHSEDSHEKANAESEDVH